MLKGGGGGDNIPTGHFMLICISTLFKQLDDYKNKNGINQVKNVKIQNAQLTWKKFGEITDIISSPLSGLIAGNFHFIWRHNRLYKLFAVNQRVLRTGYQHKHIYLLNTIPNTFISKCNCWRNLFRLKAKNVLCTITIPTSMRCHWIPLR